MAFWRTQRAPRAVERKAGATTTRPGAAPSATDAKAADNGGCHNKLPRLPQTPPTRNHKDRMPRADGTLNAREKAADIWQQQHWVDADGDPAINRVQSYPGTYVREPSAMLRGNFSLSSFGTPEEVIWWAAHENECDILMSLALDRRLDINWRNEHGCSAFYIAVVKGHIDAVQTLLGLNRDDFDYDLVCPRALDASPFWAAARAGDAAMIKVLLEESPCDFEKANRHGIAPVEAAREAGHDDVVLLIERRKRKLAGVADWPSYKPPSREKLPSIPAVRPPLSTECDPGLRLRRERKSIDELDADREANGWICKVCGRRNAASDFREPLCRVCKVPPDYDGSYTAAEERRRVERGPDLHASRRTQRRVSEMRLGYKL